MLGFIVSIFTLLWSTINYLLSLTKLIPVCYEFVVDMTDFVTDMYAVYFSELNSPIIILSYIFISLVGVRILLQVL
jgi:hypothetical protein